LRRVDAPLHRTADTMDDVCLNEVYDFR